MLGANKNAWFKSRWGHSKFSTLYKQSPTWIWTRDDPLKTRAGERFSRERRMDAQQPCLERTKISLIAEVD